MSDNTKKKKQFRLPHMYLVIAILMLFVSLLTYVVPAGSYTRGDNGAVDPDSFTYTDSSPVGILSFFTSIHKGFVDSASIIATVLLVTGCIEILNATGTFSAGIQRMIRGVKGKNIVVVILFYTIFTAMGVIGYLDGLYPFYAIVISIFMSLGYDRMVGTAIIMLSTAVGFTSGLVNPYTTGIYATLYYTKSTADNHPEFTTAVFGIEPPMPAASQKEVFSEILSEALAEECRIETVQSVQEHIGQIIEMHKESRAEEPLALSKNEIGAMLGQCGVSAERVQAFSDAFDAHFGTDAALPPVNMIDKKQFVITTPEVTVKVDPERSDMIELRKIDGLKYILIPADDVVEVNGVKVQFGEK